MVSCTLTGCIQGIEAHPVTVEVDLTTGLPGLSIVGLPDAIVNESRERLKSALLNCGFSVPARKVVINLAPAGIRKDGTGLDLPLAVGLLAASGQLADNAEAAEAWLKQTVWLGELALDGTLRPVKGVLPIAMMAKALGYTQMVVPQSNVREACLVEGLNVYALETLAEVSALLINPGGYLSALNPVQLLQEAQIKQVRGASIDFVQIKGQQQAKRALEIAAAGGHNVLMAGPPGSGKSMLAKAFVHLLPPMSLDEVLEVSRIYSVAGLLPKETGLMYERPFRSPHHSASLAGLTGGGSYPKPGEITLSHRGVLFLDELVEFPRPSLEILRQPLEDGEITISRVQQSHTFPARCSVVGAFNPCPCGYRGDSRQACTCRDTEVERYLGKLSGPLLDRMDIHLEVPRLNNEELLAQPDESTETTAQVRQRVILAREHQRQRFAGSGLMCNAEMTPAFLQKYCALSAPCQALMSKALQKLNLSARGYDRVLRLARTIADLADAIELEPNHLAEALQYRSVSRLNKTKPPPALAHQI